MNSLISNLCDLTIIRIIWIALIVKYGAGERNYRDSIDEYAAFVLINTAIFPLKPVESNLLGRPK